LDYNAKKPSKKFAAFLSHYKVEAGSDARYLHKRTGELEPHRLVVGGGLAAGHECEPWGGFRRR